MKVVLATGIYPPEIGGPATYVPALAEALRAKGVTVSIVTYGEPLEGDSTKGVTRVSRRGGPIGRYVRYMRALREIASEADIVEAFSSVSVGIPLWMAHLKTPKKVLRLGGDFLWERATDRGETKGLTEWYDQPTGRPMFMSVMNGLLRTFDAIVFSTSYQEELYQKMYNHLPSHSVIQNVSPKGAPELHTVRDPLRLLFMGRFVGFKNLTSLVAAVSRMPKVTLTLVGSGPMEATLRKTVKTYGVEERVAFLPPVHGNQKLAVFREHDVLVIPSTTEMSPNVALEARAAGLPVLLTEATGLSRELQDGMSVAKLLTLEDIVRAVNDVIERYDVHAARAAEPLQERTWGSVADEHLALFSSLL